MRRRCVGLGPQMWRLYDGSGGGSDGGNGSAGEGGSWLAVPCNLPYPSLPFPAYTLTLGLATLGLV